MSLLSCRFFSLLSHDLHVAGSAALGSGDHVELHGVALMQLLEAGADDAGVVDEDVTGPQGVVLGGDEAEALVLAEPLDRALRVHAAGASVNRSNCGGDGLRNKMAQHRLVVL
eukprot:gnl/Hemi2/11775_TR4048_c0_g1_i1.p1 gnl/Hemi2/11775_TR4048_c0_g1~~gnl/Hemi2/11775_TR4048_c0_g1_i1.p1  ORF type:complete len:113 (-),score=6.13 gnl/Hemi2/11775_TR4048_c0_g1_i1:36-374(-)